MQIIDNSSEQYRKFFLLGNRVSDNDVFNGVNYEKVGVLVIKQAVMASGEVLNDRDVLVKDVHYIETDPESPIRIESDLAVTKPGLDIVIVLDAAVLPPDYNSLPDPLGAGDPGSTIFGDIEINRMGGITESVKWLPYGWYPRQTSPRLALAGTAAALNAFPASGDALPMGYRNVFQNGAGENLRQHLSAGDEVTFIQNDALGVPTSNVYSVTIPASADIQFAKDGKSVHPQPTFSIGVDTLLLDEQNSEFLVTWRAVFPWDDALEQVDLEIT